jgi:hypothetical protein
MMNGYVKEEEKVERWKVSVRKVQWLCKNCKIEDASKFANTWAIPDGTLKPTRSGKLKPGLNPKV